MTVNNTLFGEVINMLEKWGMEINEGLMKVITELINDAAIIKTTMLLINLNGLKALLGPTVSSKKVGEFAEQVGCETVSFGRMVFYDLSCFSVYDKVLSENSSYWAYPSRNYATSEAIQKVLEKYGKEVIVKVLPPQLVAEKLKEEHPKVFTKYQQGKGMEVALNTAVQIQITRRCALEWNTSYVKQ